MRRTKWYVFQGQPKSSVPRDHVDVTWWYECPEAPMCDISIDRARWGEQSGTCFKVSRSPMCHVTKLSFITVRPKFWRDINRWREFGVDCKWYRWKEEAVFYENLATDQLHNAPRGCHVVPNLSTTPNVDNFDHFQSVSPLSLFKLVQMLLFCIIWTKIWERSSWFCFRFHFIGLWSCRHYYSSEHVF